MDHNDEDKRHSGRICFAAQSVDRLSCLMYDERDASRAGRIQWTLQHDQLKRYCSPNEVCVFQNHNKKQQTLAKEAF